MSIYKKILIAVCAAFLVSAFTVYADKPESETGTQHRESTRRLTVTVDDSAKAFIAAQKTDSVYCLLQMCASWGGSRLQPAVIAGTPKDMHAYDKFESNGIKVYVKKDAPCAGGVLTITVTKFFWHEKLIVQGMSEKL